MAFAATVEWDVRTTGSNSNGGGFDPVSGVPGTDFSQQDAAQIAYTDMVIGVTTTTFTSVANSPAASLVGNVINIISGTGFTVQRVQVLSVASGVATCDKSLGTTGSTGGTGNMGGSLLTLATAAARITVADNTVHVKSGTYTLTAVVALAAFRQTWIGYNATHRDGGTKPLITTSTNSTVLFDCNFSGPCFTLINCQLTNTAGTRAVGVRAAGGSYPMFCGIDLIVDGFTTGIDFATLPGSVVISKCELANCSLYGMMSFFTHVVSSCYVHDCSIAGIRHHGNGDSPVVHQGNLLVENAIGLKITFDNPTVYIFRCTIANNTGDGIDSISVSTASRFPLHVENCIIYGNGGYGIDQATGGGMTGAPTLQDRNNAYGSNASGNRNNLGAGMNEITLTADPFTNSAGGDYSLNNTAGGGQACRDAGLEWG